MKTILYQPIFINPQAYSDNDDILVIGSTKDLLGYQCFIGCHGDILLFNRTLTEYEISWVKNNMMCSKQQEPDIDL